MAVVNPCYCLLAILTLGSCATSSDPLEVRQYQLRDQLSDTSDEPLVKMEKARRLRGAVSMEERRSKLGQYYTLLWNDPDGAGNGEVQVTFQYQQGATASRVKRQITTFPAADRSGKVEFSVTGDNYFKNGRVLAWQATLQRGNRTLATRQSYLWR
jgi:hypothetical protein